MNISLMYLNKFLVVAGNILSCYCGFPKPQIEEKEKFITDRLRRNYKKRATFQRPF